MGKWCRGRDSNPRPPHYECGALPAELPRQRPNSCHSEVKISISIGRGAAALAAGRPAKSNCGHDRYDRGRAAQFRRSGGRCGDNVDRAVPGRLGGGPGACACDGGAALPRRPPRRPRNRRSLLLAVVAAPGDQLLRPSADDRLCDPARHRAVRRHRFRRAQHGDRDNDRRVGAGLRPHRHPVRRPPPRPHGDAVVQHDAAHRVLFDRHVSGHAGDPVLGAVLRRSGAGLEERSRRMVVPRRPRHGALAAL